MEFIEAPAFTRHIAEYLDDESYAALQNELAENPEAGDVMPGTGGFRKVRWADPRRGKGRRGGLRVIYYYFLSDLQILLVTIYGKDEAADLTPSEKRALKNAIAAELDSREARRSLQQSRTRRKSYWQSEAVRRNDGRHCRDEGPSRRKLTLRTYNVEPAKAFKVDSRLIKETRSASTVARRLRPKLHINERTLENGTGRPSRTRRRLPYCCWSAVIPTP